MLSDSFSKQIKISKIVKLNYLNNGKFLKKNHLIKFYETCFINLQVPFPGNPNH